MQLRAMAFLTRSIRQDSRLVSHHLMRAAMPAMILYLFMLQFQMYSIRAAAGGKFAGTIVTCCYWFLTLVGSLHFSTAIVEEKEEQTLALLKMTGASSFSILAGKSLPRLAVAILFLCVVAPFLILSITLGGVLPLGLVSAILSILIYAVLLSQIGLFASVVCRTAPKAFSLTTLLWATIELSHWWHWLATTAGQNWFGNTTIGGLWSFFWNDVLYRFPEWSLLGNLQQTLYSFRTLAPDESLLRSLLGTISEVWHFHMTVHLIAAGLFFLLSWAAFEPLTSRENSAGDARAQTIGRPRTAARVWNGSPLAWKSWQHLSGGMLWFWLRAIGAPVVLFATALLLTGVFGSTEPWAIVSIGLMLGIGFFIVNVSRLFGKVLNDEIHNKTLASLVMLPRRTPQLLWGMVQGTLPAVAAGATCAVLGFFLALLLSFSEGADAEDLLEAMFQPWLWHMVTWAVLTIHVGLWFTTYVRYGGMLIAVVLLWIVTPMFCMTSVAFVAMGMNGGGPGMEEFFQYVVPIMLMCAEGLACVAVQRALVRRVESLASQ